MSSHANPIDILRGSTIDYYDPSDIDLVQRWAAMRDWSDARLRANVESYSKYTSTRIAPEICAYDRGGRACHGVNFASQEYLSLASDRRVLSAAFEAAQTYGVHSAGSAALMGLTKLTIDLEEKIAEFLGVSDATVFPTGWGAGYGVIKTLVTPADHVVIDVLAHACLQEGATSATRNVHRFPHCSSQAVERRLRRIRK
ncbi:MAG: aminotransferase class I/II-fold pyridoxal phosphate-dependent enzyme [Hyphomicrobiales bacterium]|nr:aminotransferase class I/II-fold pyridoxal phosphate-dependent enzyme [Hyphomicrobiales bacterium]